MTKYQKKSLYRIIISFMLFIFAIILEHKGVTSGYMLILSFLIPYVIIGYDVLWGAVKGIINGQLLDENFLMSIATIGALFIGEYPESVAVMLFYQVGQLFESYAVGKSRQSITELMDIRPDYANIKVNGQLIQTDPYDINVGDLIVVVAGEKIPLDGIIVEGSSSVDTSALTGESLPRTLNTGDEAISGCINLNGVLTIKVTKPFSESTVSKILDLVENASSKKAKAENFITKFARYYTPIVVIAAVLLAVIPVLFLNTSFKDAIRPALNFLVVSCPCALVISVPLSFFGGIGGASKLGILIKGSNYIDVLSNTKTVVFDKTGTLTKGVFEVTEITPAAGYTTDELLETAAMVEAFSNHPIALSIKSEYGKDINKDDVKDFTDIAGNGIKAEIKGDIVYAGSARLLKSIEIDAPVPNNIGTIVYIVKNNIYMGYLLISDQIKPQSYSAIKSLKKGGIKTIMLTGDSNEVGKKVSEELNLDEYHTQLLPGDKVDMLEFIMEKKASSKDAVIFVGDGINDAPVLSRADVGISMGSLGSDAAIEASDVVIMDDNPNKIPLAIKIARKTIGIVNQNIVFAIGIKLLVMILSVLNMANMWHAVFADVGVSVIAILNAMRILNTNSYKNLD